MAMAGEPTQIKFTHRELVTALVRQQGIHEGIWGLYVQFGLSASNMGPTSDDVLPSAIVPILWIGLQKFDKENNIAVDASKVNPPSPQTTQRERTSRQRARG
jgi:hypothetical protein